VRTTVFNVGASSGVKRLAVVVVRPTVLTRSLLITPARSEINDSLDARQRTLALMIVAHIVRWAAEKMGLKKRRERTSEDGAAARIPVVAAEWVS
jgi:hypothetical protein